jgi:hypothetical protein
MRAKYARKLDAFCANAQCSGCAFCAARGESGDAGARAAALRPEEPPALVHIKGERVTAEDAARAAARRSFDAQQAQAAGFNAQQLVNEILAPANTKATSLSVQQQSASAEAAAAPLPAANRTVAGAMGTRSVEQAREAAAAEESQAAPHLDFYLEKGAGPDPTWCNHTRCAATTAPGTCNLCEHKWIFVIATGRSGSTSVLEGLNALPGVALGGENYALLNSALSMFKKTDRLSFAGAGAAAFETAGAEDVDETALCAFQQMFQALAGKDLSNAPPGMQRYYGFKELVALPSLNKWIDNKKPVEHFGSWEQEWLSFIDVNFPCARIIFNLRRDVMAEARAIYSTFQGADTLPLTKIENEMEHVSDTMLEWHNSRKYGQKGARSFLLYTEDFTPERFTQLAHWLGFPCTFHSVPHANDPTAFAKDTEGGKFNNGYFHKDMTKVNLTCDALRIPTSTEAKEAVSLHQEELLHRQENFEPTNTTPATLQMPRGFEAALENGDGKDEMCQDLPPLPQHPTCAPPAEELSEALRSPQAQAREAAFNMSELPRFFIHEAGVFNFNATVHCYFKALGARRGVDDIDKRVYPDVAENLGDLWYLQQFRKHPNRVWDPSEAHLHVIGAPLHLIYRAHRGEMWDPDWYSPHKGGDQGGPFGCGTIDKYYDKMDEISLYLNNSYYWQRNGGRDWIVVNTYYWVKDVLGAPLLAQLTQGPAIFTTADRQFRQYQELAQEGRMANATVIPYKTNYQIEDAAWINVETMLAGEEEAGRQTNLMFHGSVDRGIQIQADSDNGPCLHVNSSDCVHISYKEGSLRGLLCELVAPAIANSSFRCDSRWGARPRPPPRSRRRWPPPPPHQSPPARPHPLAAMGR